MLNPSGPDAAGALQQMMMEYGLEVVTTDERE